MTQQTSNIDPNLLTQEPDGYPVCIIFFLNIYLIYYFIFEIVIFFFFFLNIIFYHILY